MSAALVAPISPGSLAFAGPKSRTGESRHESRHQERLLARYRKDDDLAAREALIAEMLPLAKRLAARYRHSDESQEDLVQVACVGLIKAIDRYDPSAGPLVHYVVPNVLGELRRHFRDRSWGIHVSRTIQENYLQVGKANEQLLLQLGRTPTMKELAEATGLQLDDVIEALDAGKSYTPAALDAPRSDEDGEGHSLGEALGAVDPAFEHVELGVTIAPAFRALPRREQVIVHLRFVEDLTQSEIAERIGVSQMHVSRLLRRALDRLNTAVDEAA